MENQHRKITGYRDLTQAEVDLMNRIKAHGEATKALAAEVRAHVGAQYEAVDPNKTPSARPPRAEGDETPEQPFRTPEAQAEWERLSAAEPARWTSIANTHFQEGLMALTRAVAQPSTY